MRTSEIPTEWVDLFSGLKARWQHLRSEKRARALERAGEEAAAWRLAVLSMSQRQQDLVEAGLWGSRARADLLWVVGHQRRETVHCAILAWLLDPRAAHGLDDTFLAQVLKAVGLGGVTPAERRQVDVVTEETRGHRRADIVCRLPRHTVVIEAKVDAAESAHQCDDLADLYGEEPGASLVFLTPRGRIPRSATGATLESCKTLSFHQLRAFLATCVVDAAVPSVASYLQTLEAEFPSGRFEMDLDPRVVFYLEHQAQIREWASLSKDLHNAADAFFRGMVDPLEVLASEVDALCIPGLDSGWPHILLVREEWWDEDREAHVAAVGLEWGKGSAAFDKCYTGIRLYSDKYKSLHAAISARLDAAKLVASRSVWWPTWQYETPASERYWEDLGRVKDQLVGTMRARWTALAPIVDRAITDLASEAGA